MSARKYRYVGPDDIREQALASSSGSVIGCREDLQKWLRDHSTEAEASHLLTATFVVGLDGHLRLAPRRSEHIACSGGQDVLSAGEITFDEDANVEAISNQSTGFCPEPESWPAVAKTLQRLSVSLPNGFTTRVIFRLCPQCGQRNIVKDNWYVCGVCESELPQEWNFEVA